MTHGIRFYRPPDAYAHGTRARYQTGCACLPCTAANTAYSQQRAKARATGHWNGLVDAGPAREHLQALQAKGVGIHRAAALSGLPWRGLWNIRAGTQTQLRAESAKAILAIKPSLARGQRVNGYRTRHLLACLQNEGYAPSDLAKRLGLKSGRLSRHHTQVTVQTALKVRGLFTLLTAENPD